MTNVDDPRGFVPWMYEDGSPIYVSPITYPVKDGEFVAKGDVIELVDIGTSTVCDQSAAASLQAIGVAADTVLAADVDRTMRFYPIPKNALYIIQQTTGGAGAADEVGGTANWVQDADGVATTRVIYATEYHSGYELSGTVSKDATVDACLIRGIAEPEVCGDPNNAAGEHVKFIVSFNETLFSAGTTGIDAV